MSIAIRITQNSSKIFFSKNTRCHATNLDQSNKMERSKFKPPPEFVGGKKIRDCRGHRRSLMESVAPDRPRASEIDWWRLWRRSGIVKDAADLRPGSRKRGGQEVFGEGKNFRGRRSKGGFRSEIVFAFEERRGRVKRIFIGGKNWEFQLYP